MNRHIPRALYRLQLNGDFGFKEVEKIVPYLDQLGISDCYLSPIVKAKKRSEHGYDPVDFSQLNSELGTEQDFKNLTDSLKKHEMGLLLDIVPNHMCITDPANFWWWDVLENGKESSFADFFDIDWDPPKAELKGKVLLPILDKQYGVAVDNQEITLIYREGNFLVQCPSQILPLNILSWKEILNPFVENMRRVGEEDHPDFVELQSILYGLETVAYFSLREGRKSRVMQREKEAIKHRFKRLLESSSATRKGLLQELDRINGNKEDPSSFNSLENILKLQFYRLSHWRVANHEINYRRFFDINELAGIRTEETSVFNEVHKLFFQYIEEEKIAGLRIDHIDGLRDPKEYLQTLQKRCLLASKKEHFYIVVEKILTGNEKLHSEWPVEGTTGYDFIHLLHGVLVDWKGVERVKEIYHRFIGRAGSKNVSLFDVVYDAKKFMLLHAMSAELHVLARRLDRISEQHRLSRDFTWEGIRVALREVIACFPVYRTYIQAFQKVCSADRRYILEAVAKARQKNRAVNGLLFDFIEEVLLKEHPKELSSEQIETRESWVLSFQQFTGPVMAKGFEDTALYRYYPLASLNEVGADFYRTEQTLEDFHQANQERLKNWPHTLLTTTTHDTKRTEDVRSRLHVLCEIPEEWSQAINRWNEFNRPYKVQLEEGEVPDCNEEYLLYQTLLGTWPLEFMERGSGSLYKERIVAYMIKAVNESKIYSSWVNPNEAHCKALELFIENILREDSSSFLRDFLLFLSLVADVGRWNSLIQIVLKMTVPGVPDLYQGEELWSFRLVDPDNRGNVDFVLRQKLLNDVTKNAHESLLDLFQNDSGKLKLYVIQKLLALRKKHQNLFAEGSYIPLEGKGEKERHLIAYIRKHLDEMFVVVTGRHFATWIMQEKRYEGRFWGDTILFVPEGSYREIFSGDVIDVGREGVLLSRVCGQLPFALLEKVNS